MSGLALVLNRFTLQELVQSKSKDKLTKAQRSWNMSRIKGKDMTPAVRHSFLVGSLLSKRLRIES
jgi:hypothetical protein